MLWKIVYPEMWHRQNGSHHVGQGYGFVCYICSWHMCETSHGLSCLSLLFFGFRVSFIHKLCACMQCRYLHTFIIDPLIQISKHNFEELRGKDFRDGFHFEPCVEGSLHGLFKKVPQHSQQLQRPEARNMVSRIAQEQFARVQAIDEGTYFSYSTDRQRSAYQVGLAGVSDQRK